MVNANGWPLVKIDDRPWTIQVNDHEQLATMADVRRRLFDIIGRTPNLDWLLVTKRPENIGRMMPAYFPGGYIAEAGRMNQEGPRPNVWLGTSVENQATADERIPHLRKIPAAVRFLSVEPLLGPVEFSNVTKRADCVQQLGKRALDGIHWVIAGGESGPNARPMHPEWVRSIRDQCQAAGVPFHFKQWGRYEPVTPLYDGRDVTLENGDEVVVNSDGTIHHDRDGQPNDPRAWLMRPVGKKSAGRLLDGRTWDDFPVVGERKAVTK